MYIKYTTEGIILNHSQIGENDSKLSILTKDFGMIILYAKSTRSLKSKLKYSLKNFNIGLFSFVKGKEVYRLTNAMANANIYSESKNKNEIIFYAKDVLNIIRGEMTEIESNDIFNTVKDSFRKLCIDGDYKEEIVVLLEKLGYGVGNYDELMNRLY